MCLADSNAMIRGEQEKMDEIVTEMTKAAAAAKHATSERLGKVHKTLVEHVEKAKALATRAPRRQSTRNLRGSAQPSRRSSAAGDTPSAPNGDRTDI